MEGDRGQLIRITAAGRLLEVTLANPPDNRITPEMINGLGEVMERFESDEFDLLLITGEGRAFSKGFDVERMKGCRDAVELRRLLVLSNGVFSRMARSPKPTVAAINGACLGGGFELALACHFRLCAEKTRLGLPEVWLHLAPGLGGVYRLARLVGQAKALELTVLGELIPAEEALRLCVVNRLLPRSDFDDRVRSFAKNLLGADQRAVREIIRLAASSAPPGEEDNIRQGFEAFARLVPWLRTG